MAAAIGGVPGGSLADVFNIPMTAHILGGVGGAAIVLVTLITVRTLGAGGVTAAILATQLIASAIIDRFGLLGVDKVGLDLTRLSGFALLIAGTLLVTSR